MKNVGAKIGSLKVGVCVCMCVRHVCVCIVSVYVYHVYVSLCVQYVIQRNIHVHLRRT